MTSETSLHTPLRLGMVGGGQGAFIGAVHRIAARLDDHFRLVAGALSSDPLRAFNSAAELGIARDRAYADFESMAKMESVRDDGIDAVAIVTPNHMHFPVAKAFLERGIPVICDKPVTATLDDALALAEIVKETGTLFFLTHNYTGYPMIRQAREMVATGQLGAIRVVQVEYAQDWLTTKLEDTGSKQADWRTDPARSGAGGCIGDIGTHAYNLASFVTGLTLQSLSAELTSFVEGRRLDDNCQIMMRFAEGARGALWASQVAPGNANNLRLRVYGEKGGLEWEQENPNLLRFTPFGAPTQLITRAGAGFTAAGQRVNRIPSGHPEGYLEGFATIYAEAARTLRAAKAGVAVDPAIVYPTIADGVKGMQFIDAAVRSSQSGGAWVVL